MQAAKRKWFAMRISEPNSNKVSGVAGAALGLLSCLMIAAPLSAETVTFKSPREALKQGISAYSGGYYEMAVPALKFAASRDEVMAQYYLARIYSDNSGSFTDHRQAYELYRRIADDLADIDPEDDPRAPLVGKALTAVATYNLRGLPEIGLKPNPERAADLLNNASLTFNDDDAQFELAKLQLRGEGVDKDVPKAKHWLATLSRKGHAGAQAFLADLMWRGLYMDQNQSQALALISVAVANAPPQDRLWIEDIHQNIYCGAGDGIRKQAGGIVAGWGDRYTMSKKPEIPDHNGLGPLLAQAERTCQNGERVGKIAVSPEPNALPADPISQPGGGFMRGGAAGTGLRDIGVPGR